ncbi:MAG: hypothetical protein KIT11_02085 [Fimbriimonadaceae bacterium]|nr:hypothetical protein [Fimbriimonadaceae bacterium]QYK54840.1 MAG: hypothetical protein KF733_07450 [Fimbriimonadaceae bacterium]
MTLIEVVTATAVSSLVVLSATTVFVTGMATWMRGQHKIEAETQTLRAVRTISDELREAMSVTVDNDGLGLTFVKPDVDENGDFRADGLGQPIPDGVNRRIEFVNGSLIYRDGVGDRVIGRDVVTNDPENNNQRYRIFTPGAGAVVRQVAVQVVTSTLDDKGVETYSRKREVIYMRNLMETTR